MRYLPILLFCAWLLPAHAQTTYGTEHWVTFMENLTLQFNGPPSFHLVISSETGSTGAVTIPATGFSIPFSVEAGSDEVLTLPANTYYANGDEALFNFGLGVTSEQPVRVYAYHDRAYFSEATQVLPTTALGTDHIVLARTDDFGTSPSQLVALATSDGTTVEITPSTLTASFRPPGVPFTVALNEGQSIQVQALGDLSGTRVRSLDPSKPLAVFAGARQAQVNCDLGGADDHLYNQVYPLTLWGRDYFVVPYKDRGGDEVRIVAGPIDAQVTVGSSVYDLEAGEVTVLQLTAPTRIQSNASIAVGQFNDSQACNNGQSGDPCYVFLPATPLRDDRFLWNARDGAGTPQHFVNVVVQAGNGVTDMFLDGSDVSAQFQSIAAHPTWWYAQLSIADGSHELVSDKPFQAVAYGMGDYNSYGFALGFDNAIATGIREPGPSFDPTTTIIPHGRTWTPGWTQAGVEVLRLSDMRGRPAGSFTLPPGGTLALHGLATGMYIAERWSAGERRSVFRLVIQ